MKETRPPLNPIQDPDRYLTKASGDNHGTCQMKHRALPPGAVGSLRAEGLLVNVLNMKKAGLNQQPGLLRRVLPLHRLLVLSICCPRRRLHVQIRESHDALAGEVCMDDYQPLLLEIAK